ncbi:MAG TPA: MFS transporter [Verrucomicrobiae bacterium]|jgi:Na+/melibiose symporter-like transporter|nr:MFS transporter [Verrucomicrobiae bacterium]
MSAKRLTFFQRLAYGAPIAPVSMLMAPALSVLPALYAQHAGLSLAALGGMLFVTRLFDSLVDPLIGHLSDRTRSPIGARKPWMIAGALIGAISCYFWFRPGEGTGIVYFAVWSTLVYLGWSMIETAHAAWLADITDDYDERSTLAGFRTGAFFIGSIAFFVVPLLPIFSTTAITPESLATIAWLSIAALILCTALAVIGAPVGETHRAAQPKLWQTAKSLWATKPLRTYLGAIIATNISSGMVGALYFFFMSTYLDIADKIAFVAVGVGIIAFLSSIAWPIIMRWTGKHGAIAIGALGTAATLIAMLLIKPGPLAYPMMLGVFGLSSLTATAFMVAMSAIMADVVDYDELRSRKSSAGVFYSLNTLVIKLGVTVGGSLSLILVSLFGFDPTAATNTDAAMRGFFIVFIGIPILLNLTGAALAWRFPITRAHHNTIRRRLEQRRVREARLG